MACVMHAASQGTYFEDMLGQDHFQISVLVIIEFIPRKLTFGIILTVR